LQADNVQGVLNRLNQLDAKFNIKHRIIVESANRSADPRRLVEGGFHVSYYLPTSRVLTVVKESEPSRLALATELAQIVQLQQPAAVSFDLRLYGFVKTYLGPLLDANIQYHTWFPGVSFESTALIEKLSERAYFNDDRVKTILLPYSSLYSL
jgi:heptose-I-phosphate ethanolaminephosphotransferase